MKTFDEYPGVKTESLSTNQYTCRDCPETSGSGHCQHGRAHFVKLRDDHSGEVVIGGQHAIGITDYRSISGYGVREAIRNRDGAKLIFLWAQVCGFGALVFLGLAPIVGSGLSLLAAVVCGMLIGAFNGVFVAFLERAVPARHPELADSFFFFKALAMH